ncbi:Serine hydroxymethyltransferase 2 [compost metagenome]
MTNRENLFQKLQSTVFPSIQGCVHVATIASEAGCLGEVLTAELKDYGGNVKANACLLTEVLHKHGVRIVSGGTDSHLARVDISSKGLTGQQTQDALSENNITSNKNPIRFDSIKPSEWWGLSLDSSAGTTRGFGTKEFEIIGNLIPDIFDAQNANESPLAAIIEKSRTVLAKLIDEFLIYAHSSHGLRCKPDQLPAARCCSSEARDLGDHDRSRLDWLNSN